MSESQKSLAAQLVTALDEEIRRRPRGTIFAMERELGKSCGWWHGRVASQRLSAHYLFEVLDHLGLDRVGFLRQHVGREDGLELNQPQGPMPEIVERALERSRLGDEGSGIGESYIATLDEQRYKDPEGVVRSAEWTVDHVELPLLPRLLGIAGSALRLLLRVDDAEHCLYAAVETCHRHADEICLGNLLRRYSYVLGDQTNYSGALRLAEQGTLLLLRVGDRVGAGKGTLEQGMWLYYSGRHRSAARAFEAALKELPADCARYRFAAFHALSTSFRSMGDLDKSLAFLSLAEVEGQSLGPSAQIKTRWLRARLQESLNKLDAAAEEFEELVRELRDRHLGETVLLTCELVRVRLRQGRQTQAFAAVRSMLSLLEPLRNHRVVSEAIADLARQNEKSLSLALLERVISRLEGEQSQPVRWARLRVVT